MEVLRTFKSCGAFNFFNGQNRAVRRRGTAPVEVRSYWKCHLTVQAVVSDEPDRHVSQVTFDIRVSTKNKKHLNAHIDAGRGTLQTDVQCGSPQIRLPRRRMRPGAERGLQII